MAVTEATTEATVIQTRHRIPETPLTEGQIQELAAFLSTQTTGGAP